jgi:hypothetical protein
METETRLEDAEIAARWPQEDDRLFPHTGLARDTFLAGSPDERSYRLPKGYKRAGDVVLEHFVAHNVDQANLIYPALFCYRQAVELFLKTIVERFGQRAKNIHDLKTLWANFLQLVKERGQEHADGLAAVEKLILEMHEADRRSDTFRFSTDSSGARFAFGDRRLDLERLADTMQGLQNFFECCYLVFWEQDERR